MMKICLFYAMTLLLVGCGNPAGTPCQITGSGFTASHDCQHQCLSRWTVVCPDGSRVSPAACSGSFECSPGSCPDGQVCYHDADPFEDRSFCIMADTCGDVSRSTLRAWELATIVRQHEVITDRIEKQARRKKWQQENPDKLTTTPAQDSAPGATNR